MKEYNNKIINFNIFEREDSICGLVTDYNDNFTLLNYSPVDYVIDGFTVLRNDCIENYEIENNELKEKILNIKKLNNKDDFKLDFQSILNFFYENNQIFSLELNDRKYYIGKIIEIKQNILNLRILNSYAEWTEKIEINIDDVDIIEFENDYINSLCLIISMPE